VRLLGIPLIFAFGALVSRLALRFTPSRFTIDLTQPIPVATNWGWQGALVWLTCAATIAAAFIVYRAELRAARSPSTRHVLLASGLACVAGLFWLPLLSSDIYAYAAYGEMARLGIDPYVHHAASADALIEAARWQWSGTLPICVYGEGFVAIARALVTMLHGLGTTAVLTGFRVLTCAALLLCGYLASRLGNARTAIFIACNPIAIFAAIEGHNDTLMLAGIMLGLLVLRRAPATGAAIVALTASIKSPALAASAAIAIERIAARRNALATTLGTLAGWAFVLAGSLALIHGVRSDLAPHGHYHPLTSVQALGIPLAAFAFAAVLLRARTLTAPVDRWCAIALALWIAIPNPYPWYALWLLPVAAFARDPRVVTASLAVSCAALLRYLPDAVALPPTPVSLLLGLVALAAYAPLLWRRADAR
jgi:alpha-1,6-mannosyltransferase